MKTHHTIQAFKGSVSIIILSVLVSCGGGGGNTPTPASPQDQAKALLTSGTWKIQSEAVDGVDKTSSYTGFTITFSASGYTTTKGGGIWPASGSWSFQGTSATTIVRNDNTVIQIVVTDSSLVMTISWTTTTLGSGRAEATSGNNVFTMTH